MKAALDYCVQTLRRLGADKFQCSLKKSREQEMNLEGREFTLIRTTVNNTLDLTVIKDERKGSISLNRLDQGAISEAVEMALELARTSPKDPDYDISPQQKAQQFAAGPRKAEEERMYELLKQYSQEVPALFPAIKLLETVFVHKHTQRRLINSNGAEFQAEQGLYDFSSVFSSREGEKTTSFNYTGFALADLQASLLERASLKLLLRQTVEHLEARPFWGKFVGEVLITPDCLQDLLYYYTTTFLGDRALISQTSPFKDKLGQEIAHPQLTLAAEPLSPTMADGYFFTEDGFAAENVTLIDKGVLKSFLLTQYGSKKTGLPQAKNQGGCWVVQPGQQNLEELISQMKQGLMVARYSGGSPSPNGDFSGVAKNSYYIENGQIQYPVTETMIAGNLADLFKNIKGISQERIDYGAALLPYLWATGVTVSGK